MELFNIVWYREAKNNVDGTEMDGRAVTIVFARQKRKTPEEMRRDGRRGDSRGRRGDHGRRGSSRDRRGRSRSRDRGGDRDRGYGGREERGRDRNRYNVFISYYKYNYF
jgi:hypothetical protein